MALEAERLVINLEARIAKFDADMRRAVGISDRNFRQIQRRAEETQAKFANFGAGIGRGVGLGVAGILGVQGVGEIARYAAEYRDMQNALKVTGLEGAKLESTFGALSQIALKQGAPLDALVQLYGRVSQSAGDLKASQADLLAFSDGIATALRVSGKSASEASGALLQLGQALGGSKIQAEEYNSLLDGAYPLLQAVANGLKEAGGSVAKLTALVKDGKVPTEAFFRAALAGFPSIAAQADKAQGTIAQSMSRIRTAMTLLIGKLDETAGASTNAATNLNRVADVIQALPGFVDAAATGLDTLTAKLQSIGSSDVFVKLRDFLGVDGEAASAEFMRRRSQAINIPGTSIPIRSATPLPAGAVGPLSRDEDPIERADHVAGQKAVQKFGEELETATVSLEGFSVETDGKKADLKRAPIETAEKFIGATEGRDSGVLKSFFREAGVNIDPRMTAWCAAFVNAALGANGFKGTGSLSARSFLNYGEETKDPRRGDIAVFKRGSNAAQGHVGFFEGYDEQGNVRVLGGNQKNGVSVQSYKSSDLLGFRSIPGAERASTEETLSAELERRKDLASAAQEQSQAYQDVIARGVEFIGEQNAEAAAVGQTAQQAAALRYEQELLNQAYGQGLALTPEQTAQIKQLAAGMAEAEQAASNLGIAQGEIRDAAKDAFSGFADDLIAGKSAGEALLGVLDRLASRLLSMALDKAFENIFAGVGGGQGFGIGKLFGFASGGYTGAGGKHEAAGIVHKGEFVMSKAAVERIGLVNLDRMHRGYANGGFVGMHPPSVRASAGGGTIVRPQVNVRNYGGANVRTEEGRDERGQPSIEVIMDQMQAGNITKRNSQTAKALRGRGVTPSVMSR